MILLKKILNQQKSKIQFLLSVIGIFIGLFVSALAIVLFADIKLSKASNNDVFGANNIVIQKRVTQMTSLGLNTTQFTDEEINILKQTEFISRVAPFKSANYEVGISENPGDGLPHFYADMFLQSVPNNFINEMDSTLWGWTDETDIVPIILPRDFLTLVNYGIAPSQGLPQVSEGFIKSIRMRLHLIGPNKKGVVLGQVVGFSSQISSVLVPESFIDYSNELYAPTAQSQINRLFINIKEGQYAKLLELIETMNLDISETTLNVNKVKTYLSQIISIFIAFSLLILILSLFALLQYMQLTIVNLKSDINLLMKIGYQPKQITHVLKKQLFKVVLVLASFAFLMVLLIIFLFIHPMLSSTGLSAGNFGLIFGFIFLAIIILGFALVLEKVLRNTILKIYKKG